MDKCSKVAGLYIASLKAITLIHQHNHWTTHGYDHHLLFERVYKSASEDLDEAAEKFFGVLGPQTHDYDLQTELLNKILTKYKNLEGSPVQMSIAIEKDFIKFSKEAFECFEREGKLTLGMDDMIMSHSSRREGAVYLLQQGLDGKPKD